MLGEAGSERAGITAQVVVTPRAADAELRSAALDKLSAGVAALPNVLDAQRQVSPDGRVAVIRVQYPILEKLSPADLERLKAFAAEQRAGSPLQIELGGDLFFAFEESKAGISELIGIVAAVVILLVAFGSVIAMGLPIGMAIFGLVLGISSMSLIAYVIPIPAFAPQIASMIGLGVGIDYALLMVTRHREHLAEGMAVSEAAARSVATAGRAVVFAGGTVVIAILGLIVAGIPFLTAAAVGISTVVLIMVLASITLLPGLPRHRRAADRRAAGALGRALAALGRSRLAARSGVRGRRDGAPDRARPAGARPAPGNPGREQPPHHPHRAPRLRPRRPGLRARDQRPAGRGRRRGRGLAGAGRGGGRSGHRLRRAARDARRGRHARSPTRPRLPQDDATFATIQRLRATVDAHIGGNTADWADIGDRLEERLPYFLGAVVLLSFLLLTVVFRSVLVPLKAAVLNLLGVGAAYGVMVVVFQWGWAADLIGLDSTLPIIPFIPVFMFAVLFGLSMDYEVFLLSRVREHYLRTGDNHAAVTHGIARTARVITAAALIMIAVFGGFVFDEDPRVKMFGLGLATAILVDATIIRLVLVPAIMQMLGDANWWLPRWLGRVLPERAGRPVTAPAVEG